MSCKVTVPMWEGRRVRLPRPVEAALAAMYGHNWRHDFSAAWRVAVDPFLIGYCDPLGARGRHPVIRKDRHGATFIEAFHPRLLDDDESKNFFNKSKVK